MPLGSELAVSRALPQAFGEQQVVPPRGSKYRELYVQNLINGDMAACDEGSYFTAANPTIGTGAGMTTSGASGRTFSDTLAGLVIMNRDAVGGKRMYLRWLRLTATVAATTSTDTQFAFKLDTVLSRYTSGGTAVVPTNPNGDSATQSVGRVYYQTSDTAAMVTAASTQNARVIDATCTPLRVVIGVVGDIYHFNFGANEATMPVTPTNGTAPITAVINCAPCVIGPQNVFTLHTWQSAQTVAPIFVWTASWIER